MALSGANNTAITQPFFRAFSAVQISLSGGNINLCDGSGFATFTVGGVSTTFKSLDPVYGSLSSISAYSEALATSASTIQLTLMPPSSTGIAALADPNQQGVPVNFWFGILNESTGLPVAAPELVFSGRFDFAKTSVDGSTQTVQLEIAGALDRFFTGDEGALICDTWHQSIWPGELGLANVIEATSDPFWGKDIPRPAYPSLSIAPTIGDRTAGNNIGGFTNGQTYGP